MKSCRTNHILSDTKIQVHSDWRMWEGHVCIQTEKAMGCGGEVRVQEASGIGLMKGTRQREAARENPGPAKYVACSAGSKSRQQGTHIHTSKSRECRNIGMKDAGMAEGGGTSERSPPPQPTSRIRKPVRGLAMLLSFLVNTRGSAAYVTIHHPPSIIHHPSSIIHHPPSIIHQDANF